MFTFKNLRCLKKGYRKKKWLNPGDIESLYKPVIEMLLTGNTRLLEIYRRQFATARVKSIENDGYGIFVNLIVDPSLRIIEPEPMSLFQGPISGVCGLDSSGEPVCGFALFDGDGCIELLDGYTYKVDPDVWPEEEITLAYVIYRDDGTIDALYEQRPPELLEKFKIKEDIITADGHVWKYDPDHE